mmetsp:Transcript_14429/g.28798  ORF Transcript_14429/g.28798 Transcript_14429/m.28798 type:complete len:412 (-) Transcript_14429:430-1665(-)
MRRPVSRIARIAVRAPNRNLAHCECVPHQLRLFVPNRRLPSPTRSCLFPRSLRLFHRLAVHAHAQRPAALGLQRHDAQVTCAEASLDAAEGVRDLGGGVGVADKHADTAPRAPLLLAPRPQLVLAHPLRIQPLGAAPVTTCCRRLSLLELDCPPRTVVPLPGPDVERVVLLVLDMPHLGDCVRVNVRIAPGEGVPSLRAEVRDHARPAEIDVERMAATARHIPGLPMVVTAHYRRARNLADPAAQRGLEQPVLHALWGLLRELHPQPRPVPLDLVDAELEVPLRRRHCVGREELSERLQLKGGLERAVGQRALHGWDHRVLREEGGGVLPGVVSVQRVRSVEAAQLEGGDAERLLQPREWHPEIVFLQRLRKVPERVALHLALLVAQNHRWSCELFEAVAALAALARSVSF